VEQLKPDATAIYVAAHQAAAAIEEAIQAEVPLIVAVAEHIPLHDMLRVSKATVVDVNHNLSIYSDNSRSIPC
jgi:succinyl-CoA synthetase alpha subunit